MPGRCKHLTRETEQSRKTVCWLARSLTLRCRGCCPHLLWCLLQGRLRPPQCLLLPCPRLLCPRVRGCLLPCDGLPSGFDGFPLFGVEWFRGMIHAVQNKLLKLTASPSGDYNKSFDKATQVLIQALDRKHRGTVTLDELCDLLQVQSPDEKNGVLWGVRRAKDTGILKKTTQRGVYSFSSK